MLSARDLVLFAKAHMQEGVGDNGARILSARSTRAMQQLSIDNRGKGYTGNDGMGLGWMITAGGLLHHGGGGPGIVSALYAVPERQFAAAILTNAEHGSSLINEFLDPWLESFGITPPSRTTARQPSQRVEIGTNRYDAIYEDIQHRYRIGHNRDGLTISAQAKFTLYDSVSTQETTPDRLTPLGDDKFLWVNAAKEGSASESAKVVAFRNPDTQGRMQHLGVALRLYNRVS